MARDIKTVKVSEKSLKGFWSRSIFTKSMDSVIASWQKKGYKLTNTTPIADRRGKTTHYLLTFEKD